MDAGPGIEAGTFLPPHTDALPILVTSPATEPSTLHTPLMSGANAIHGVILLGAILVTGSTDNNIALVVGLIAIVLAAVNMVGGFVVTDRMLQMFVRKKSPAKPADGSAEGAEK